MKKYYFDMDGVLADFDGQPNALGRFIKEVGFFLLLKPTQVAEALQELLKDNQVRENVYILSSSPNQQADYDKLFWIYDHLPLLKHENIIFVRGGDKKKAYAEANAVLIDDYSENLLQWEEAGGVGIKLINGRNGSGKKWKGKTLTLDNPLQ
jgi:5'(3')-deoxyribonucleotidase